ncbi:MAG TPA: SsrA-binding protein [Firmicutes bacterium]|nr:SsrA-binding protein [Bacillota bacterium]HBE05241.1 SsrA-binding protein [Bacillota bacterium]HBL50829.1 SsrA-binding protein [Bacillota bacterium]HCX71476.1 SsrA-binding protein [Bacillota bacterium]
MPADSERNNGEKNIVVNRQARHEYFIIETYEAGIALAGTEVKSLRQGKGSLNDAFARVEHNEMLLYNMHISPYDFGNRFNLDPLRPRKLLLHKEEIRRLYGKTREKGLTLVPLRFYLKRGKVKVELALAKGKRLYDKREDLAARDAKREVERAFRGKE